MRKSKLYRRKIKIENIKNRPTGLFFVVLTNTLFYIIITKRIYLKNERKTKCLNSFFQTSFSGEIP